MSKLPGPIADSPLTIAENNRPYVSKTLRQDSRAALGQYFTPAPLARFMATLFEEPMGPDVRLLDAGAGLGALTAAFVERAVNAKRPPKRIQAYAFEIDQGLVPRLEQVLQACHALCVARRVVFDYVVHVTDFIDFMTGPSQLPLLVEPLSFTHTILNPPYAKLASGSMHRHVLRSAGIETSNLYTAFVSLAVASLESGGELVAITPRSFCNGTYFKPFRRQFLSTMSFRRLHVFDARNKAFRDDEVLQENIIYHAVKAPPVERVFVSTSDSASDIDLTSWEEVDSSEIVRESDHDQFIRLPTDSHSHLARKHINSLQSTLAALGLSVSTGRVVDFRTASNLRSLPEVGTVPLIYPSHMKSGFVQWPQTGGKKPNSIVRNEETASLLLPNELYVVIRRFSPKEEKRRISAAVYDGSAIDCEEVGFENHLNVIHVNNRGISRDMAFGLSAYLNSTLLDNYFRQFSGHTQINSNDLRSLPFPSRQMLERIGSQLTLPFPSQSEIDRMVNSEVANMSYEEADNLTAAKTKIEEAKQVLQQLGMPRAQINDRSALTLLALLDLKPSGTWNSARSLLIGITPVMEFADRYYGKKYAPNTRETVRRQTMHQFVQAGLVIENPDDRTRAINSPHWCYQIEPEALLLLQSFGTVAWSRNASEYLQKIPSLRERYEKERYLTRIPVSLPQGGEIRLSPGPHNELQKQIVEEFAPRFAQGSRVLYVGDTEDKFGGVFDRDQLEALGVKIDTHGKMPDVVLYDEAKGWLYLIEAVTSHGPVDAKRRTELAGMFRDSTAKPIYVTAFPNTRMFKNRVMEISWETEVWVADSPSHMIHFDGERFLGPYES